MRYLALAVLASACLGAGTGDGRSLQFTPAQLKDSGGPAAAGVKVPLGVQSDVGSGLFQFAYVEATLEIRGPGDSTVPATGTDVGRFEAVFPSAGEYTLTGKTATAEDRVTVRAKEIDALRLVGARVYTLIDGSSGCSTVPAPGTLTLRANQYLEVSVGGTSAEGEALLGAFAVDVLDLGVTVNRRLLFPDPNVYIVTPRGTGSGRVEFTERTSGKKVAQELERDAAMATCP
jgi:hypothetical protein